MRCTPSDQYRSNRARTTQPTRSAHLSDRALVDPLVARPTDTTASARFTGTARRAPLPIGELDPVVFPEVARAVDLLVSVAAFALDDDATRATARRLRPARRTRSANAVSRRDAGRLNRLSDLPPGVMARHRRQVLSLVFAEPVAQGRITIDERHVRAGAWSVHCATGRVTRDGEPVEPAIAPQPSLLRAVPWLPYDEALLQRIVDVVAGWLD
ncbi:hypothetical protein [Burkholderia cenocepacia]|uniref:hypothetical protein n=1 Tax=Burkholderia cenocepacia TaxID=95486 RepID=UPI001BA2F884|nr:hypothetical protein [Burkholderia cenocepacia]MBR8411856.1 hypothetical protein [Burkholderia cenocepacia]